MRAFRAYVAILLAIAGIAAAGMAAFVVVAERIGYQGKLRPSAWQDPEFLAGLREQSSRITIPDGGTATANLELVGPKQ